jgi:glycerol-3-phosphate acyltransferase PlsX
MDDVPVEALKQKRDSSIVRMAALAAAQEVDAVISAGNTGACVAACQLRMRTLAGVGRPGIAVIIPSLHGPIVICDVGANIAPKPFHLLQYAQMATVYSNMMLKTQRPRVGLLSIGEEEVKGNTLVKEARQLIKQDKNLNYIGNVEGRDLFRDAVDVVICDGFVGNVVLKLTEGLAEGLFKTIAAELTNESPELGAKFKPVMEAVWARHDYAEYGGAPLLGVDGVCIICHGSSNARAIKNAVRVAYQYAEIRLNDAILKHLTREPDV